MTQVEVFVGILPCSHYTYVEASLSQKREDFIQSVNNNLRFLGGSPKAIVPDNLKSAVTKASKYEPVLNKSLKSLGLHYQWFVEFLLDLDNESVWDLLHFVNIVDYKQFANHLMSQISYLTNC